MRVVELGGGLFDPLDRADGRIGEVCFVIHRPGGRLLTAINTYYPAGAYRLPTGGIKAGESVLEALRRETREETSLETKVGRFLVAVAYRRDGAHAFVTLAFLLDEIGGTLANADPSEQHGAFGETDVAGLEGIARRLETLPEGYDPRIRGSWRDWGRFRAVIHRLVRDALDAQNEG